MELHHPDNLVPPEPRIPDTLCEQCEEHLWPDDAFTVAPDVYVCEDCVGDFLVNTYAELTMIRRRIDQMAKKFTMGMA